MFWLLSLQALYCLLVIHLQILLKKTIITTDSSDEGDSTSSHTHTYSDTWTYDENYHWHCATCEHTELKFDYAEHTFGNAVTITKATYTSEGTEQYTCTVCGYTKKVSTSKLTLAEGNEWWCFEKGYLDNGSYVNVYCYFENNICTICGITRCKLENTIFINSSKDTITKGYTGKYYQITDLSKLPSWCL